MLRIWLLPSPPPFFSTTGLGISVYLKAPSRRKKARVGKLKFVSMNVAKSVAAMRLSRAIVSSDLSISLSQWYTVQHLLSNKCWTRVRQLVERNRTKLYSVQHVEWHISTFNNTWYTVQHLLNNSSNICCSTNVEPCIIGLIRIPSQLSLHRKKPTGIMWLTLWVLGSVRVVVHEVLMTVSWN